MLPRACERGGLRSRWKGRWQWEPADESRGRTSVERFTVRRHLVLMAVFRLFGSLKTTCMETRGSALRARLVWAGLRSLRRKRRRRSLGRRLAEPSLVEASCPEECHRSCYRLVVGRIVRCSRARQIHDSIEELVGCEGQVVFDGFNAYLLASRAEFFPFATLDAVRVRIGVAKEVSDEAVRCEVDVLALFAQPLECRD